jgi:hypothetical protein
MANRIRTTKNGYGVEIVMCCASCQHKEFDTDKTRICTNGEGVTRPSSFCTRWQMRKGLDKAGKGGGGVKTPQYLRYVLDRQAHERELIEARKMLQRTSLAEIRAEYAKAHGPIFLTKQL